MDAAQASAAGTPNGPEPGAPGADTGRHRTYVPGFQVDCGAPLKVPHVGVVFVHGIGSQAAGETLLDWSSKIIALLIDERAQHETKGDPVIDVQLDPSASSRFIELRLPEAKTADGKGTVPEQHWVMTEAWWAERVRPPAFGDMAEWLGPRGAIRRIVSAMLPRRRSAHDPRLRSSVRPEPLGLGSEEERPLWDAIRRRWHRLRGRDPDAMPELVTKQVVKEPGDVGLVYGPPWWAAVPGLGLLVNAVSDLGTLVTSLGAGLYFQAISALVLVLYGALRSIEKILPIGPLKDGALTRPIDRFVLEWFGDVYVLLRDPAQAASVRGRLIDAIRDLEKNGCSPIVVVAHSGGAIVSYMTLTDEAQKDLKVDRLITLGEGLNLAWRLTAGEDGVADEKAKLRYDRLYSDVFQLRPNLQWDDFWASQDPAPVGVLAPEADMLAGASLAKITSHAVWNRLAFREDHGSYWENDEEFLIPVARLLDRNPPGQRMFVDTDEDREHSLRRRRRLTFLSLWRQLALVAPTAAIVLAYAIDSTYVVAAGEWIAGVWNKLPGSDLISRPIDTIRGLHLENTDAWRFLAEAGIWVIVAVLALLTLVALIAPPERPVPWSDTKQPWRPPNLFALFLRAVPLAVAIPVVIGVIAAARKFMGGATPVADSVGRVVLIVVLVTLVGGGLGYLFFVSRNSKNGLIKGSRDGVELVVTIGVMVVVAVLAISPFVAVLVYEEVGTTVLGFATIIIAFQLIARIGSWRWGVWDGRERVSVRIHEPYPPPLRIVAQMVLLVAAIAVAFVAIVSEPGLTMVAVGIAVAAVLLGVAVDVMDAAHHKRREPGDAMAQGGLSQ